MQRIFTTTLVILAVSFSAFSQATVVQWLFNGATAGDVPGGAIHPTPSIGIGSLQTIGGVTSTFNTGSPSDLVQPSGSNFSWQTTTYPAPGTGDQTAGIIITFDSKWKQQLTLTFDQRLSSTANNTWIVYYTADPSASTPVWQLAKTFTFTPAATGTGDMWYIQRTVDLSAFTVLNDNSNAGLKIVSAFDPTAGNYLASQSTKTYVTTGNSRFDRITISGFAILPTENHIPTASNAAIAGSLHVADTLRSSYTYADDEADVEGATTFAWLRADDVSGTNPTIISGAQLPYYVLTDDDYGKFVAVLVTPVAQTGTLIGVADTSALKGPVDKSLQEILYPEPFDLSSGNYILNSWASTSAVGTYPPNMTFQIYPTEPASLDASPSGVWGCLYNNTSKARMLGLDDKGIGFLNTSDPQGATACGNPNATPGYVGSAVVALNTGGLTDIIIHYQTSVELAGDGSTAREYHLVAQYKLPEASSWTSWAGNDFSSSSNAVGKNLQNTIVTTGEISNRPLVYVRWIYRQVDVGGSGTRPEIRLDNILIESSAIANQAPVANSISVDAPSLKVGSTLTGHSDISDFESDAVDSLLQWFRATNNSGANAEEIVSAKGASTYTLTADDVNKFIAFSVTPTAASGKSPGIKVLTDYVGPVAVVTGIVNEATDVQVYPIPTASDLTIVSADDNPIFSISVMSITGKELVNVVTTSKTTIIPFRDIQSGLYLLMLSHKNGSRQVRKIVRE